MRRLWGALAFIALIVRFSLAQGVSPTPPADGSDQPIQPIDPDGGEPAGSASGPATGSAATGSAATGSASMGSGSPITPATAPSPAAERAVTVDDVVVDASRLRFGILLFGDVSARLQAPAKPSSHFSIGAVGMRLNANLGSNVDALGEIAFEAGRVDVEQLVLNYRTPRWVFSLGRLHTELGYWNTAYHHGFWLQPLIARPHPIRFEDDGGLVPVHWVGAHLMHRIPVDSGEVILVGGVGNGRGKIVDDILIDGDVNQAKGFLLKLAYRRHGEHRIDVGTTAIIDRIPPADAMIRPARPDKSIDELIVAAHLFYRGPVLTVHAGRSGSSTRPIRVTPRRRCSRLRAIARRNR